MPLLPCPNTVMYFPTSWRNGKNRVYEGLFGDISGNMIDQTAQTHKSDVFTCGIAAFTDIIYLVCTADSVKLCIYSKARRWKWWCCAKLFKVTGVSNSRAGESLTRHTWLKLNLSAGDIASPEEVQFRKKKSTLTGEFWEGLHFRTKPDTCLHSKFKAVQLTTWYSCLFGWKVRPCKNLYLHKTFDLTQMNAQEKATAALLRLEEFICHISQNYLCWCQLCGIGAGERRHGERKGERSTAWEKHCREGTREKKKEGRGRKRCIHPAPCCLIRCSLTSSHR